MGGQLGAAYVVIAHDISVVVNDGDSLRVLPVIGGAAVQNLRDVVFLRGIDLGVTNLLTLNQMKASRELGANLRLPTSPHCFPRRCRSWCGPASTRWRT
jgi:hypothetical protein